MQKSRALGWPCCLLLIAMRPFLEVERQGGGVGWERGRKEGGAWRYSGLKRRIGLRAVVIWWIG